MWDFFKNFFDLLLHGGEAYHRMKGHPVVTADDAGITFNFPKDDTEKKFAWSDLKSVDILTTANGPFLEDVFFILQTDQAQMVIPQETAAATELMDHFKDLPGFQWESLLKAMTCTNEAVFQCWKRDWNSGTSHPDVTV